MIAKSGVLADLIAAGARVLESACGPCLGMGQAPATGVASLRSFNRNFKGRSGTAEDQVYLASPATCAVAALSGKITDPRDFGAPIQVATPTQYVTDDNMIISPPPADEASEVEIIRGPNIKPVPIGDPLGETVSGSVLIKVGDNITTDHIMPAGAQILPLRSNIPAISAYVFHRVDAGFVARAKELGGGVLVGGANYGQGSSREHAALAPMYLGVRAVIAKSFSRIHHANLINAGILPLVFDDEADYDTLDQGDRLVLNNVRESLATGTTITATNTTKALTYTLTPKLTERERKVLLAGGMLSYIREMEA
jgi:aconitate hydratase